MDRFQEFEKKVRRSLNTMDTKTNFIHEGVTGLRAAFKEFNHEITDFMAFTASNYAIMKKELWLLKKTKITPQQEI